MLRIFHKNQISIYLDPLKMFKTSSDFCGSFLLFSFTFVFSAPCRLVITCLERAYLLPLLYVMFVTFPYGISGRVRYLIASIPDFCLFGLLWCTHYYIKGHSQRSYYVDLVNYNLKTAILLEQRRYDRSESVQCAKLLDKASQFQQFITYISNPLVIFIMFHN